MLKFSDGMRSGDRVQLAGLANANEVNAGIAFKMRVSIHAKKLAGSRR